ncbi:MAG TPA: AI-2E family transporter [Pyrinomonadaceae bacterium]|nr:AI-2E family transporter [Pyrinomonadaceae bacterium]
MTESENSTKHATKDAAVTAAKAAVEAYGPPTRVILRVIFIIITVLVVLWMIAKLTGVILLLVLSIFFAYLVSPLVEFIGRPRKIGQRTVEMPRSLAIACAYLILLVAVFLFFSLVLPTIGNQFPEFAEQAKSYWRALGEKAQQLNEYFRLRRMPDPVVEAINNAVAKVVETASSKISEFVSASVGYLAFVPWLILIPLLAFFLLKDVEGFRRSALQMLPRGRWRWRGDEFFQDINTTLAAYARAQLTASLFIGIVCSIGFAILGLPAWLVMGLSAGVFEFVPLIGPLTVAILAALLATLHSGVFSAFLVLVFLGVLRIVQDYFIYPRLIGHGIHLHPLAVIFAILCGAELAGVAGILLAIPVVAILTVSYKHWLEHRGSEGLADLLETQPAATPVKFIHQHDKHPDYDTTPEEMTHARPDLTTGELKMPVKE